MILAYTARMPAESIMMTANEKAAEIGNERAIIAQPLHCSPAPLPPIWGLDRKCSTVMMINGLHDVGREAMSWRLAAACAWRGNHVDVA